MTSGSDYPPLDITFYHDTEVEAGVANGDGKWKGGLKARMDLKASQVWDIVGDFGSIQKWGLLAESKIVQGQPNVPGCVRYCKGASKSPDGEHRWACEKLLAHDGEDFSYTYAIIDGNFGWEGYVATIRVLGSGTNTSEVEWVFELEPLNGKDAKQTVEYISRALASKVNHLHEILSKEGSLDR